MKARDSPDPWSASKAASPKERPPYSPELAAGPKGGMAVTRQATQTDASGTLLDNADLLLQLYHCLGGILRGTLLKPASLEATVGHRRSLT